VPLIVMRRRMVSRICHDVASAAAPLWICVPETSHFADAKAIPDQVHNCPAFLACFCSWVGSPVASTRSSAYHKALRINCTAAGMDP